MSVVVEEFVLFVSSSFGAFVLIYHERKRKAQQHSQLHPSIHRQTGRQPFLGHANDMVLLQFGPSLA